MKHKYDFTSAAVVWIGMVICGWLTSVSIAGTRAELPQPESAADRLLGTCAAEQYELTAKLRRAFLAYAKEQALALTSQTVYDRYQKYLTGCAEQFRKGIIDVKQFCMRSTGS